MELLQTTPMDQDNPGSRFPGGHSRHCVGLVESFPVVAAPGG